MVISVGTLGIFYNRRLFKISLKNTKQMRHPNIHHNTNRQLSQLTFSSIISFDFDFSCLRDPRNKDGSNVTRPHSTQHPSGWMIQMYNVTLSMGRGRYEMNLSNFVPYDTLLSWLCMVTHHLFAIYHKQTVKERTEWKGEMTLIATRKSVHIFYSECSISKACVSIRRE